MVSKGEDPSGLGSGGRGCQAGIKLVEELGVNPRNVFEHIVASLRGLGSLEIRYFLVD